MDHRMDQSTIALHRIIVRALKGILVAYEQWINHKDHTDRKDRTATLHATPR